jgi:hypothetical protein
MNASKSTTLRITGMAVELDGFVRSFELLDDDLELVSISYHNLGAPDQADDVPREVGDLISLDLHFGVGPNAESTYELVMEHFRSFQRRGIDMQIEQVDDPARAA